MDWTYPEGKNVTNRWDCHTIDAARKAVNCDEPDELARDLSSFSRSKASKMSIGVLLVSNEMEFIFEAAPVPGDSHSFHAHFISESL